MNPIARLHLARVRVPGRLEQALPLERPAPRDGAEAELDELLERYVRAD